MTKKAKKEKCSEILHKYPVNSQVNDNLDIEFLMNIFECHTEWHSKAGCGIKSISIRLTEYKSKCFQINRIDGTSTDISFNHCLNAVSELSQIKKACRTAIFPIIKEYKITNVNFGVTRCVITGEILTEENTDIDHYDLTFIDMFNKWYENKNHSELFSKLNNSSDNDTTTRFTDLSIVNDFQEFHNRHCKLRAVTKIANQILLRKFS
jgi:hypothetical protein